MHLLFLDTASHSPSLALCDTRQTLILKTLPKQGESKIIPILEDALEKTSWRYEDLTHLACAIGPGGFTSVRIGVTAINVLAWSLELPSAGVHLSDLWSACVRTPNSEIRTPFLWLHSTRKTHLFVKGFGTDGTSTPTALMGIDEARALRGPFVGELIPEHQEVLKNCHPMPEEQLFSLEEMLPTFLTKPRYRKQRLVPWYGRDA